jgi:hypothetical protein
VGRSGFHVPASPLSAAVDKAEAQIGAELTGDQVAVLAVFFDGHPEPLPVECNDHTACDRRAALR